MFIIATCFSATDKRVIAYEVVSSVPASLGTNQYSVTINDNSVPDGFDESFDKFTVGTVNGANGFIRITGSVLNQRALNESVSSLMLETGFSENKVKALKALPWAAERLNKIRNLNIL